MGRAHVTSCFAQCTTLAQEVPALVELDLDRGEPPALGIVARALLEQTMLFSDKILDVREYGYVLRRVVHVGDFRSDALRRRGGMLVPRSGSREFCDAA